MLWLLAKKKNQNAYRLVSQKRKSTCWNIVQELSGSSSHTIVVLYSTADLACSNSDFSILCTLIVENGLAENLRSATWTVFAPTDEAFENAPPFPSDRSISWLLMGHTVPGVAIPFEDLACSERTTMGNGKDTRTVCKSEGVYQKGRGNSDEERPEIILADVEACNGIVHVVNEVILY